MSLKYLHACSIEALKYISSENEQLRKEIKNIKNPPPSFTEEDRKKLEKEIEDKYLYKIRELNNTINKKVNEIDVINKELQKIQENNNFLTIRNVSLEKERQESLSV